MPNRIIRESITTSNSWDRLSFAAEAFCTRLITIVDDYGRMDARPSVLRARCFPLKLAEVTETKVAKWLGELVDSGLVVVYVGDTGGQYLQFINWSKYQNIRAKESKFPAPGEQVLAVAISCDQLQADVPVTRTRISDLGSRISGGEDSGASASTPERERAVEYAIGKGLPADVAENEYDAFLGYYGKNGWKLADNKTPITDRWMAWTGWVSRELKRRNGQPQPLRHSRPIRADPLAGLREWNEKMDALEAGR